MYQIECTYKGIMPSMHDRFRTSEGQQEGKKTPEPEVKDKLYQDSKGLYIPADNIRMMLIGNSSRPGASLILGSHIKSKKATFYKSFCEGCIWVKGKDDPLKIYYMPLRKWDEKDEQQTDERSFPFGTGKSKGRKVTKRPLILIPWTLTFIITVTDDNFPEKEVKELFTIAGLRCGAGAYGPTFGQCVIIKWAILNKKVIKNSEQSPTNRTQSTKHKTTKQKGFFMSLQISKEKTEKMQNLEDAAIDVLNNVLKGEREVDEQAKVAMKTLAVVAKNWQTLTHKTAIEFTMASSIGTEAELKKYVAVTNPQVKKALTGKT